MPLLPTVDNDGTKNLEIVVPHMVKRNKNKITRTINKQSSTPHHRNVSLRHKSAFCLAVSLTFDFLTLKSVSVITTQVMNICDNFH